MGLGLLGALAGIGKGANEIADNRIKMIDTETLARQEQEAEALKAQRAMESAKQLGIFNNKLDIEKSQALMDQKTDPANVEKMTRAGLLEQKAKDEYGDSRLSQDVEREGALARAKHIVDPADQELKRAQAEYYRTGKGKIAPDGTPLPQEKMEIAHHWKNEDGDEIVLTKTGEQINLSENQRAIAGDMTKQKDAEQLAFVAEKAKGIVNNTEQPKEKPKVDYAAAKRESEKKSESRADLIKEYGKLKGTKTRGQGSNKYDNLSNEDLKRLISQIKTGK